MADSCNICAQITNHNGEVVDSRLFKDLLHYTSNDRATAKKLYQISMNQEFMDKVKDRAQFDENGEITLKSLLDLTKTSLNNEKVLNALNDDIGAGTYSYQEAIQKLQNFNRDSQWKDNYLATLTPTEDGQYHLSVVKKTSAEESRLNKIISNQTLLDRIISILASHGVAVDFLKDGNSQSRYSTENAVKTADGMYHLIRIVNGEKVTEELAEEAGHFAVGALGNSPLVERLLNLLTPEVQREALGSDTYENKYLGKDSRREVAGDLVGRALNSGIDKRTAWGNLVSKIADLARRVFYTIKGDSVRVARLKAEQIADQIAKGFMSPNFGGSLEQALETSETLYSADYSYNVKTYKKVVSQLAAAVNEFKAMNSSLAPIFENILAQVQADGRESVVNQQVGVLADSAALGGIAEAMDILVNLMGTEIPQLLDSVDFNNAQDFAFNMARNGRSLSEAHTATKRCLEIMQVVNDAIGSSTGTPKLISSSFSLTNIQILDRNTGRLVSKNLIKLTEALSKFTSDIPNGFYAQLKEKEYQFFLKFLTDSYGDEYVNRGARVLFKWRHWNERGKHLITFKPGEKISLDSMLRDLDGDISIFDRWFGSMSNSSDVISQIVDKVTKQANKQADDITNQIWDQLKALRAQMKDIGVSDPVKFYEKDSEGNLTGNVISSLNWGKWEDEYNEFMKQEKENFKTAHRLPNGTYDYDNKTDFEKALMWQSYFNPLRKKWHKDHSAFDPNEGRWIPMDSLYHNNDFDKLSLEERQWLGEMMALKEQLDNMTGGAMPLYRLPQFKGTFMNRVRNRGSRLNPSLYGRGMWEAVKETFCIDSEDTDYGSELTYNTEEEDMFGDRLAFEKEKLNRLPLFGINKLQDMSQLSTDIFQSMLAYAGMATHYAAMSTIVDTLEVGKQVLNRRTVGGVSMEVNQEANKSRAFNRYLKYLEKQVYGVSQKPIILTKGIVVNKIASFLSGLASKVFLGGNVAGGLVNLGTGINEIFKEAASGEFFTMKDWAKANVDYWKSLPQNLWDTGKLGKESKVALFIRHFNILGLNKSEQRDWHTYKSRAANFLFGKCLLLPYSSGDHYMQNMSYLSIANGTKLIDEEGNVTSLWDAYTVDNIEYTSQSGNTSVRAGKRKYGQTLRLKGTYFKSVKDRDDYVIMRGIVDAIENAPTSIFGVPTINLTQEQKDWLVNNGYNIADVEATKALLKNDMVKKTWNTDDESAFMDKAREINDRLHGIYNDQDKVALSQSIFGNMVLAMRGYALGMIQRRVGVEKYSVALGGEVEGTLRTAAKVIMACSTDSWGFGKAMMAFTLPLSKRTKDMMIQAGFSPNQYANMRRNFMDYLLIGALVLLKMLTAKPDDDEDERKEYYAMLRQQGVSSEVIKQMKAYDAAHQEGENFDMLGIVNYFATRLLREQMAYNTNIGAEDEWTQISSLTPSGVSVLIDLWTLGTYFYGDLMYDYQEDDPEYYEQLKAAGIRGDIIRQIKAQRKEELKNSPGKKYFYQSSKKGIYEKGDPKWERKLSSILPFYRSRSVWYHPYEAVQSFEYGRKVKSK